MSKRRIGHKMMRLMCCLLCGNSHETVLKRINYHLVGGGFMKFFVMDDLDSFPIGINLVGMSGGKITARLILGPSSDANPMSMPIIYTQSAENGKETEKISVDIFNVRDLPTIVVSDAVSDAANDKESCLLYFNQDVTPYHRYAISHSGECFDAAGYSEGTEAPHLKIFVPASDGGDTISQLKDLPPSNESISGGYNSEYLLFLVEDGVRFYVKLANPDSKCDGMYLKWSQGKWTRETPEAFYVRSTMVEIEGKGLKPMR
jgi:hypothetical protein